MKKLISIVCILALIAGGLSGCTYNGAEGGDKISIVCTVFPQYDWVREIIGERADYFALSYLSEDGVDSHSFSPSISQATSIKNADLFIHIGGISDGWVEGLSRDSSKHTINMIEVLGDDVLIFGNFCGEDCNEDHNHNLPHEAEAPDEHVWVSLRHAMTLCREITDVLAEMDPDNAELYKTNAEAYIAKLLALDGEYVTAVEGSSVDTIVFADRFPFRYLMSDYGLTHYAAFQGCSAETEASFSTIISLANRLDSLNLKIVVVTETSDKSIAETVINTTEGKDQRILVLHSMKMVTPNDVKNGTTYISIMKDNLSVIKEALRYS
ncbi:MAG: metal ABC transporter substrate-binding protein [Oscillospiraceae bacterium]|nr:metal ABC transporter substrate-binding protein [Oscillospiraceae bacterium]